MTITLSRNIESALAEQAHKRGTTPERLALDTLREQLVLVTPAYGGVTQEPPCDAWEALLLSLGSPAGVSLSDAATSRDSLYD